MKRGRQVEHCAAPLRDMQAADDPEPPAPKRPRALLLVALKGVQLAFAVMCLGMSVNPFGQLKTLQMTQQIGVGHGGVAYVAYSGCLVFCSVWLLARLAGEEYPIRAALLHTLVNGVLQIAAAGVVLYEWTNLRYRIVMPQPKLYQDLLAASGIFAVFNGIVHFVDIVLTIKFS